MILDLPPNVEQVIVVNAQSQGISPEEYVASLLPKPRPESFYQAQGIFASKRDELLAFQQELRNEWD